MERRDFLGSCLAAGAAGTVLTAGASTATGTTSVRLGAAPGRDWFEQAIGERFHVDDSPWSGVELRLVAVEDGPRHRGLDQFTAVFEAPPGRPAAAGLYAVRHPAGPWFRLYLDPGASRGATTQWRAVFSLHTAGAPAGPA